MHSGVNRRRLMGGRKQSVLATCKPANCSNGQERTHVLTLVCYTRKWPAVTRRQGDSATVADGRGAPPGAIVSNTEQSRNTSPVEAPSGASVSELLTDSNDPEALRTLLDRARERLSFYEGFDRLISENIRHSGELMQEAIAMRDQVAEEVSAVRRDERAHLSAEIEDIARRVSELGSLVDQLAAVADNTGERAESDANGSGPVAEAAPDTQLQVVGPLTRSTSEPSAEAAADAPPARDPEPAPAEIAGPVSEPRAEAPAAPPPPREPEAPTPVAAEEARPQAPASAAAVEPPPPFWPEPRTVDVIAQPVYQASTALALQRFVGELEPVVKVEAREFAGGILRLQVTSKRELTAGDLQGWDESGILEVRHSGPGLLHLGLEADA